MEASNDPKEEAVRRLSQAYLNVVKLLGSECQLNQKMLSFLRTDKETQHTKQFFDDLRQTFGKYQRVKFYCGTILEKRYEEIDPNDRKVSPLYMYQCKVCGLDKNSMCCIDCFDFSKHKEHKQQFGLVKVMTGSCDCGDPSKWEQKAFCDSHAHKKQDREVESNKKEFLKKFCTSWFIQLCYLYEALQISIALIIDGIKTSNRIERQRVIDQMIRKVDKFGEQFIRHLLEANKDRYSLNCITRTWLRTQLAFKQQLVYVKSKLIQEQLMRFLKLPNTARTCIQLYLLLFCRGEGFKKEVTQAYIRFYSQIPYFNLSRYRMFSIFLFGSHKLIDGLINIKKMKGIALELVLIEKFEYESLEKQIEKLKDSLTTYYRDLSRFSELKEQVSINYYQQMLQNLRIIDLATYSRILTELQDPESAFKIFNKKAYCVQLIAMATFANMLSKINRAPSFQKIVRQIGQSVLIKKQTHYILSPVYMLLSEYRVLSMSIFAYLYNNHNNQDMGTFNKKSILGYLQLISFSSHKSQQILEQMLGNMINYFVKISKASSSSSRTTNQEFFNKYFLSKSQPNLLFSLDAFVLRFATHCLLEVKGQQTTRDILLRKIDEELSGLQNELDKSIRQYHQSTRQQDQKKKQKALLLFQNCVIIFQSFVSLVTQSFSSDLVELVLLTYFQGFLNPNKFKHAEKLERFYRRVLQAFSLGSQRVSISHFRGFIQCNLLKEDIVLNKFITQHKEIDNHEYLRQESQSKQSSPFNINDYPSLKFKAEKLDQKYTSILAKSSEIQPRERKYILNIFYKTRLLSIFNKILRQLEKERDEKMKYMMVKQLIRVYVATKDAEIQRYLSALSTLQPTKKAVQSSQVQLQFKFDYDLQIKKAIRLALDERQQHIQHPSNMQSSSFLRIYDNHNISSSILEQHYPSVDLKVSCSYGNKCICYNKKLDLHFPCFISLTNMHSAFEIDQKQRLLTFSTCGHLVHRLCSQSLSQANNRPSRCPKCSRAFNLTLLFQSQTHGNNQRQIRSIIQEEFNKIAKIATHIPSTTQSIAIQIYRSITLFLLQLLIVDDLSLFKYNILIYRNLFFKLHLFFKLQQSKLLDREMERRKNGMVSNASSIPELAEIIRSVEAQLQSKLRNNRSQGTKDYLIYVNNVLEYLAESTSKLTIKPLPAPFYKMTTTPLQRKINQFLQPSLSLLKSDHKCTACSSRASSIYYVCLMPRCSQKERKFSLCFKCMSEQQTLAIHIEEQHFNQALIIQTSTGKPWYLYLSKNSQETVTSKLAKHEMKSLYTKLGVAFEFHKLSGFEKEQFKLSLQKIKQMLNAFYSGQLHSEVI